jgi:hypothetical protein
METLVCETGAVKSGQKVRRCDSELGRKPVPSSRADGDMNTATKAELSWQDEHQ